MIDLHLHTTASDGRCGATELVYRAWQTGITVLSVTDHDTTAALPEAAEAATVRGLDFVPGIEITAVASDGRDVHVLGYFIDPSAPALATFLSDQRADRIRRVTAIVGRLADLGCPVNLGPMIEEVKSQTGRVIGRPHVADALVRAGHAVSVRDAFDRWLADGRPGFVPRVGASPEAVIAQIHGAGGVASLAHPGLLGRDEIIPGLVRAGLDALEIFHSDHTIEQQAHYRTLADRQGLAVTGGSDYHGKADHGAALGAVALPVDDFNRLRDRARRRGGECQPRS